MRITNEQLAKINRMRNTPLVMAARLNDSDMDHSTGKDRLPALLRQHGLDVESMLHVTEQRLARAGLAFDPLLGAVFIDALFIGWRAARMMREEYNETFIESPITHAEYDAWTK
jgi:hypothetical protein